MHVVTKVLVVFAAVLSVFLSALVIAYSVNADRITGDYQAELSRRLTAEASLSAQTAQFQTKATQDAEVRAQLERDLAARTDAIRTLERTNADLALGKSKAEQDFQSVTLKIAELGETAKTQAALLNSFRDENQSLRKNELRLREQMIQADDRIADLQSSNEVLTQNLRALQEQLTEARLAREGGATTTGAGGQPFVYTGEILTGRVESINKDAATGQMLAKINLGSNNQIRNNMLMRIGRGTDFVANLVIVETDQQYAIGRIDTLNRDVSVQVGDTVSSRLQ